MKKKDKYYILRKNSMVAGYLFVSILFMSSAIEKEVIYLSKSSLNIDLQTDSPAYAALEDSQNSWSDGTINYKMESYEQSPLTWGENKELWVLEFSDLMMYTKNTKQLNSIKISTNKIKQQISVEDKLIRVIEAPAEELMEPFIIESGSASPERVKVANKLLQASWVAKQKNNLSVELEKILEKEQDKVFQGKIETLITGNKVTNLPVKNLTLAKLTNNTKIETEDKSNNEKYNKSYVIKGNITFAKGLAYSGPDQYVKIYRLEESLILNEGYVNLAEGYFEIKVNELYGYLIAELIDKDKKIIGLAEIDLNSINLNHISNRASEISYDLELKIFKEGFNVRAISGASFLNYDLPIGNFDLQGKLIGKKENVLLSIDGLDNDLPLDNDNKIYSDMFTKDSNMIMRLEAKNHWGSLAIGFGKIDKKMRIYKNTLVDALINDYKESHDGYGVIWGRVVDENGSPVSGAKVELAGELAKGPMYFNSLHLIDHTLTKTKGDGLFAFVKVLPGLQVLRAVVDGKELPTEITVSDSDHTSYVEIKMTRKKHITLNSYNPITKNEVSTSVKLYGSEKIYDIEAGIKNLQEWPGKSGITILESDPGERYLLTRQLVDRRNHYHEIPVVAEKWLDKIFKEKRLNKDSTKGIIVGFVNGDSFDVFAGRNLDGWSKKDIIYFDKQGNVLSQNMGHKGGGFMMYNVPEDVTSLNVISKNSEQVSSQIALTDRYFVSVVSVEF